MTSQLRSTRPASPFCIKRWTRVRLAKDDSADGRRALADSCDAYFEPVTVFLHCELRDADGMVSALKWGSATSDQCVSQCAGIWGCKNSQTEDR